MKLKYMTNIKRIFHRENSDEYILLPARDPHNSFFSSRNAGAI